MTLSDTSARRASLISRRSAGFFSGSKQSSPEPSQLTQALDAAGVRLRMFVGGFRFGKFAGLPVDVIVALAGAVDAVGPVQPSVEPLRRVRCDLLLGEHEAQFVVERLGVFFASEIAAL